MPEADFTEAKRFGIVIAKAQSKLAGKNEKQTKYFTSQSFTKSGRSQNDRLDARQTLQFV
jgi:hypothetical protein